MRRAISAFWPWLATLVATVLSIRLAVEPAWQPRTIDIVATIGMGLLAVPAIRINEQGRLIARIQSLQKGIDTLKEALKDVELPPEKRKDHEKSLAARRDKLNDTLDKLSGDKGAWTTPTHLALYGGYVLLFGAALARVLT